MRLVNAATRVVRSDIGNRIHLRKLYCSTLRVVAYADGSFSNILDGSSQLEYFIILSDASMGCNVLSYPSFKSRRVTRSVLGAKVMAFADAFDCAFVLKRNLQHLVGRHIPLAMLTDSRSLFDVITKHSSTSEKRLMIDIAAAREGYPKLEISDIGLVQREHNEADAFIKVKMSRA